MEEKIICNKSDLTNIADRIRMKNGSTDKYKVPEMPDAISAIPSGGGDINPVPRKDVNFYDYDGTLLHSYTVEEAQALTALPDLPSHNGLICQGWNWTLEQIKSENSKVNVGAMYTTDDGKTRIYIHLENGRTSPKLSLGVNGTVGIDWGDGTTSELTGTNKRTRVFTDSHNYASAGDYVITLTVSGEMSFLGPPYYAFICADNSSGDINKVYSNAVQRIEIGDSGSVEIGSYAFYHCTSLSNITIPASVLDIGRIAFAHCYSLSGITIPTSVNLIRDSQFAYCTLLSNISIPLSVTTFEQHAFWHCYKLSSRVIPSSVTKLYSGVFYMCHSLSRIVNMSSITEIPTECFLNCSSLTSVTVPSSVTKIGMNAFKNCYGVAYYDFSKHTSIPTLGSNAFVGIASDCKILVPASLVDAWKSSTNWSAYADYIVGV